MSILANKTRSVKDTPVDGIYVIYGHNGTGKTVLASTFPKTKEAPLLYLDVLEGDTGSISESQMENIVVADIQSFNDLTEVFNDIEAGETLDEETGVMIPVKFSTIVISTATQLEYLLKQHLMEVNNKDVMSLNLWGQAKTGHDQIWNMAKFLNKKTGANIVILVHQKEIQDEENPAFNKTIPSLMNSAAYSLCAKASFVWYTKIETEPKIDPKTQEVTNTINYVTYIDAHPYLLTKCRKPAEMKIPLKVNNLTYPKFKKHILDKL